MGRVFLRAPRNDYIGLSQREVGVREMPRNESSSRLQVSANQADGSLRAATHNLFHSEAPWVYKGAPPGDQNGNPSVDLSRRGHDDSMRHSCIACAAKIRRSLLDHCC